MDNYGKSACWVFPVSSVSLKICFYDKNAVATHFTSDYYHIEIVEIMIIREVTIISFLIGTVIQ